MNVGMLWLDDDSKRPLEEKVLRAVEYYEQKYGRPPELCLVNPEMLAQKKEVGRIEVRPLRTVLPHHFWLGMKAA
jgi:hypothetical protein